MASARIGYDRLICKRDQVLGWRSPDFQSETIKNRALSTQIKR